MMQADTTLSRGLRAALLGGLVALCASLSSASVAQAQADGPTWDQRLLRGLLKGMGAAVDDEDSIQYRERSPLVVPPKLDLPPPQSAATVAANPAWPKDADTKRRQSRSRSAEPDQGLPAGGIMSAAERDKGRIARGTERERNTTTNEYEGAKSLLPSVLGYTGGVFSTFWGGKEEYATFKSEPPRMALTDPPPGYQTPSPSQPYGTTGRTGLMAPPKAYDFLGQHGTLDNF
jgi:hypothetical protein